MPEQPPKIRTSTRVIPDSARVRVRPVTRPRDPNQPKADRTHPQYEKNIAAWTKCRTVVEGEEEVKAAGEKYLPSLGGADPDEYASYLMRALFYNAADRTVMGLAGAVMRKVPSVEVPESMREYLKDLGTEPGVTLEALARDCLEENMTTGRYGLYVDASEEENSEPFIALYFPENIINWREKKIGGKRVPTLVVIQEEREVSGDDIFDHEYETIYRVLILRDGVYQVEIWVEEERRDQNNGEYIVTVLRSTVTPRRRGGKTFDFIPFCFVNPAGVSTEVNKSPILDLVNVNLSHYRTSADLEHGRHFTSLPQAWVAGFDIEETHLRIGSTRAWVSENTDASAGMLEFTGEGLGHLADALKEKEQLMAILGARILEEQKQGVETAAAVKLRHAGENSMLAGIARAVGQSLTLALKWVATWKGLLDAEIEGIVVKMNTEFTEMGLDPQMFAQLLQGLQSGAISYEVFYYNLERGSVYPEGRTIEEEKDGILDGPPMPPPGSHELPGTPPSLRKTAPKPLPKPAASA